MRADRLGDLVADAVHRIEAAHRVLEDHRDPGRRAACAMRGSSSRRRSSPSSQTDPPVGRTAGGSRPIAASAVSDLPEPLSPTIASVSPEFSDRLTSSTGRTRAGWRVDSQREVADLEQRAPRRAAERRGRARADRCRRSTVRRRGARIERIAQRVAQQVHRQDGDDQRRARPQQQQRRLLHGGARAADHQAPGRRRRHHAEAEERQAALEHDGGGDRERELHQHGTGDVRQNVRNRMRAGRRAERAHRLDVVVVRARSASRRRRRGQSPAHRGSRARGSACRRRGRAASRPAAPAGSAESTG